MRSSSTSNCSLGAKLLPNPSRTNPLHVSTRTRPPPPPPPPPRSRGHPDARRRALAARSEVVAMHPVQPDSAVTVNCKENPLECQPCPGGGACYELAEPPPPPIPVLPRAPTDADRHAPVRLLLTVSLLSAFLFLTLALATLFLYRRRRRILRRRRHAAAAAAAGALPDEDWFDEEGGGGGGVVHHVWYIRTVGLDDATIASIATVEYRGGVGRAGDCAVCLGEFSDGELIRLLPRCTHPFHAPCIDTWLRAHVNCPICRSPVVVAPTDLPAAALEPEADVAQREERQVLDGMSMSVLELQQAEGSEDSDISSDTQSDNTEAAANDCGRATPNPIRRSASMDSPLFLVPVPETNDDDTQCNPKLPSAQEMRVFKVKGKEASGTSSSSCQSGRFKVGRSMSSSGLGFFFSRNVRTSGTVLPL